MSPLVSHVGKKKKSIKSTEVLSNMTGDLVLTLRQCLKESLQSVFLINVSFIIFICVLLSGWHGGTVIELFPQIQVASSPPRLSV